MTYFSLQSLRGVPVHQHNTTCLLAHARIVYLYVVNKEG